MREHAGPARQPVPNPRGVSCHVGLGDGGGSTWSVILASLALHPWGGHAYSSATRRRTLTEPDKIEELPVRWTLGGLTRDSNLGENSANFHPPSPIGMPNHHGHDASDLIRAPTGRACRDAGCDGHNNILSFGRQHA